MGRTARCACRWGERAGYVTALLESSDVSVRGAIRARVALGALEAVRARGENLEFVAAGERVELALGSEVARRWAAVIGRAVPTLAGKLGVTPTTRLHVAGEVDDDALCAVVLEAAESAVPAAVADLAIVRTDDAKQLQRWLDGARAAERVPPVWIVYVKGRAAPLGEKNVRALMLSSGFVDTKVAAVSARLTALRFVQRRISPSGVERLSVRS